ncbi:major capsid protein [Helicobacter zhangjianzhongii]|uniref:major capsid protein n=1 Tax=Helicobacter zhangjianzhongii TaxID=2974574 RepID=UPI002552AABF|nr:major capsid protein [Helicobacter sp. CPD2-1]MDL0081006.1 hypothetical protein [Helicobacter sp. CPD2-1]
MRKRSKISLSNYHLTTAEMGTLFPVNVIDVLPGDSIQQVSNVFMRMSPMLAPVMHPIQIRLHHWFVPYRLIWDDFEDFITGGPRGVSTPEFPVVKLLKDKHGKNTLSDYFRLPVSNGDNVSVSALPYRAYHLIWNEFYRDQDLQEELPISYESGLDSTDYKLQRVSWKKDYFTTARPWTQKGVEVGVPVYPSGGDNNRFLQYKDLMILRYKNYPADKSSAYTCEEIKAAFTDWQELITAIKKAVPTNDGFNISKFELGGKPYFIDMDSFKSTYVSGASAGEVLITQCDPSPKVTTLVTINERSSGASGSLDIRDLRLASALQRFEEARAKYGSRYNEFLMYLGVTPQDSRLQLPEYLGGGRQIMQISEVLQTAEGQDSGVGTMRGHGLSAGKTRRYRKFIPEHGVILTLMSVLPDPIYMQGVERMWLKRVKEDFYHQELASIGMQEVYQSELFATEANQKSVFGYQDRYDEYRHAYSGVSGDFRDTLDYWHLARKFDSAPVLNGSFIQANPTKRIFAEQTTNPLWIMVQNSVQARRMMSKRAKTKLQ